MPARSPRHGSPTPDGPDRPEDLDLGDLPGRWQLLAVATFFAGVAVVFGVPYLLGYPWLWEHARLVGPLLGAAFFFGTQRWWFRKAGLLETAATPASGEMPATATATATAPAVQAEDFSGPATATSDTEALVKLLGRARWALVRWWGTWVALGLCIAAVVIGNSTTNDVNAMIDSQPHQKLTVVKVTRHPLSNDGPDVTVDVPGTGPVDVFYSDYIHPVPHVGDKVDVVVDPDDPTDVVPVAYRHSSDNSWWMGLLILAGLMGFTAYLGWWNGATPRHAARAVRRADRVQHLTVESCDAETAVVSTAAGVRLRWSVDGLRTLRRPPAGVQLQAVGNLVPGGQAAVLYRNWVLWTGELEDPDAQPEVEH